MFDTEEKDIVHENKKFRGNEEFSIQVEKALKEVSEQLTPEILEDTEFKQEVGQIIKKYPGAITRGSGAQDSIAWVNLAKNTKAFEEKEGKISGKTFLSKELKAGFSKKNVFLTPDYLEYDKEADFFLTIKDIVKLNGDKDFYLVSPVIVPKHTYVLIYRVEKQKLTNYIRIDTNELDKVGDDLRKKITDVFKDNGIKIEDVEVKNFVFRLNKDIEFKASKDQFNKTCSIHKEAFMMFLIEDLVKSKNTSFLSEFSQQIFVSGESIKRRENLLNMSLGKTIANVILLSENQMFEEKNKDETKKSLSEGVQNAVKFKSERQEELNKVEEKNEENKKKLALLKKEKEHLEAEMQKEEEEMNKRVDEGENVEDLKSDVQRYNDKFDRCELLGEEILRQEKYTLEFENKELWNAQYLLEKANEVVLEATPGSNLKRNLRITGDERFVAELTNAATKAIGRKNGEKRGLIEIPQDINLDDVRERLNFTQENPKKGDLFSGSTGETEKKKETGRESPLVTGFSLKSIEEEKVTKK